MGISGVKADFPAHIGDADAVAIPGNARDHALQQAAIARGGRRAETQGIKEGNGAGAHSQDVPDDAADTGGRPLQGFHRRGVVVGFHLEHYGQAVANVHRPGIFRPGLGQDMGGMAG